MGPPRMRGLRGPALQEKHTPKGPHVQKSSRTTTGRGKCSLKPASAGPREWARTLEGVPAYAKVGLLSVESSP